MGRYRVLFPVGFMNSRGQSMSCTTVGAVVDVDDEQAVQLVADGKLEAVEQSKVEDVKVDAPASRASAKAKIEAGE